MNTYTNDVLRASLGSEHTEDTSTATNVKNSLALEQVGVVQDRVTVCASADAVLQHLLVNACKDRLARSADEILWSLTKVGIRVRVAARVKAA